MKRFASFLSISYLITAQLFCASTIGYAMEAGEEQSEETEELTQEQEQSLKELAIAQYILANLPNSYLSNSLLFEIIGYLPPLTRARVLLNTHMSGAFGSKKKNPRAEMEKQLEKLTLGNKLFGAIDDCNLEAVKQLIEAGADLGLQDKDGLTPLMYAIKIIEKYYAREKYELVEHIAKGMTKQNLNLTTPAGKSTLILLAEVYANYAVIGLDDTAHLLTALALRQGADVNIQDHQGQTPLMKSITPYVTNLLMRAILQAGADTAIVDNSGKRAVDIAYEQWKDKNHPQQTLCLAILECLEDMKALVAEVNSGNLSRAEAIEGIYATFDTHKTNFVSWQYTPLTFLIDHGRSELAQALIDWNIDVNEKPQHEKTPLATALTRKNFAITEALLKAGAGTTADHTISFTDFQLAIETRKSEFVELLLRYKKKDLTTTNGSKGLILIAIIKDLPEIIPVLVKAGARVTKNVVEKARNVFENKPDTKYTDTVAFLEAEYEKQEQKGKHEEQ